MRFRFCVTEQARVAFEQRAEALIDANGYRVSDFRDYDYIADAGSNRFLGTESRQPGRDRQRADLTVRFYNAISKLVTDALVGPDEAGRFQLETNDDRIQNPRGSIFQSPLHLFCNMTNAPTDVYLLWLIDLILLFIPSTAPLETRCLVHDRIPSRWPRSMRTNFLKGSSRERMAERIHFSR